MKKITNMKKGMSFALKLAVTTVVILSLSACANQNNMKVDLFAVTQQDFQTIDAMNGQKNLYDQAYSKAQPYFAPEDQVGGAVIASNLKSKEELAGFFQRLVPHQQLKTIVVIETFQKANPASKNIVMTTYGYKTPYGILPPEPGLYETIKANGNFSVDDDVAKQDAWSQMIAPFIAKSFPGATFMPIFVDENTPVTDLQSLSTWLNSYLPQDSLVLAQAVPKTSDSPSVAEFQLKFMENVLENFDDQKYEILPVNSAESIQVLENYLALRKAQRMQNQFMDPATGNFLSFSTIGPMYQSRSVFMVAFGDIMFDRMVRTLMDTHTMDYPFQRMDQTYLRDNDILVANLEGPIAEKRVQTSKTIAFRFNPDIVPLLKKYYFDALSQANNHAMDMGEAGFNDTFNLLAPTGIKAFGDPRQIDDKSVATFNIQGEKIAFLGLEEVIYKIDDAKAIATIKDLTAQGYKVIPFMHWGIEYQHEPNTRQEQLAHEFIDAGAVAVIGAHPHSVEPYENYKNRPIFYSLGNAIFDQYFSPDTQEGLSVAIIISDDQLQIYLVPIKIDRSQFRLMTEEERTDFLKRFVGYGNYETEAEQLDILSGKITIPLNTAS